MDKNTFGKSPCFVRLAEILDEINDEKLTSRVSKILHYYSGRLKKIDYLEDRNDRIYFASLVVNSQAKSVAQRFFTRPITVSCLFSFADLLEISLQGIY